MHALSRNLSARKALDLYCRKHHAPMMSPSQMSAHEALYFRRGDCHDESAYLHHAFVPSNESSSLRPSHPKAKVIRHVLCEKYRSVSFSL